MNQKGFPTTILKPGAEYKTSTALRFGLIKPATDTKAANSVADRLKTPVVINFRRQPLQEALEYISKHNQRRGIQP